ILNKTSGFFTSPFYPQNYPNSTRCTWLILAPNDYTVTLIFHHFDVEAASPCIFDAVNIYDGSSIRDIQIGKYCGHNKLPPIQKSTGSAMLVELITDVSDHFTGFNCSYHVVKRDINRNIRLSGKQGIFFSPNYPSFYNPNFECVWTITVPHPWRVRLSFDTFSTEGYNCAYDYVEVRDGLGSNSPLSGKFCGSTKPRDVYSSSSQLWIRFTTDKSTEQKGFLASYSNNDLQEAGHSGFILSPNYPSTYPTNIQCTWKITVPVQNQVELRFENISLPSWCQEAHVKVIDGKSLFGNLLGTYCGDDVPVYIHSTSNIITVMFMSSSEDPGDYRGFNISYNAVRTGMSNFR
ncbi:predicted protein, partial [Nematostella vectensis]